MFPLQDTVQSRGVPLATWGIILLNGLIFLYELSLPPDRLEWLIAALGMVPSRFEFDPQACLAASVTHWVINPESVVPTIGTSGAIASVLGTYFILFPTARVITLVPVFFFPLLFEVPAVFYLGLWFVSPVFSGTVALGSQEAYDGVAWSAHVGGLVTGMALLPLFDDSRTQDRRNFADEYWPW